MPVPELLADMVDNAMLLVELEGRGVLEGAVDGTTLACHGLDEHADGHTGWEGMRVDHHIRNHARLGEGHVLLWPEH